MKKELIFSLFLFLILPPFVSAQSPSTGWKEYLSSEGKFSILLPGTPTTGYRPVGADSDTSVTLVTNLIIAEKAWLVAYFDLSVAPPDENAIKKLFDQTRDRMLKMYSLRLAQEENLTLLGYPVRSFKSGPDDQNRVFYTRIYLVRQRVYQVWALTGKDGEKSESVVKYFDSFKPVPLTDEEISKAAASAKTDAPKAVPRKIRVSNGLLQLSAIKKVQPVIPAHVKASGVVEVSLLIDESGEVIEATVISGHPLLRNAAIEAARQWRFKPTLLDDKPVKVEGILLIEFKR